MGTVFQQRKIGFEVKRMERERERKSVGESSKNREKKINILSIVK